mmetsp:Transcript_136208/g.379727  ORF Transcript_136208/g.379727 Transcript_136208/m.379727 type:complete len:266 (+) Transcript_136208:280-1077(+)
MDLTAVPVDVPLLAPAEEDDAPAAGPVDVIARVEHLPRLDRLAVMVARPGHGREVFQPAGPRKLLLACPPARRAVQPPDLRVAVAPRVHPEAVDGEELASEGHEVQNLRAAVILGAGLGRPAAVLLAPALVLQASGLVGRQPAVGVEPPHAVGAVDPEGPEAHPDHWSVALHPEPDVPRGERPRVLQLHVIAPGVHSRLLVDRLRRPGPARLDHEGVLLPALADAVVRPDLPDVVDRAEVQDQAGGASPGVLVIVERLVHLVESL